MSEERNANNVPAPEPERGNARTGGYSSAKRDTERKAEPYVRTGSNELDQPAKVSETANINPMGIADYANEILNTARRMYLLPIILAVVFSAVLCIRARLAFNPVYQASATFTVEVTNSGSKGNASYSVGLAKQLSETFPFIFSSDVLSNLIMQDLGLTAIPATITAEAVGETNLFTINVYSRTPQMSYNILHSAIEN